MNFKDLDPTMLKGIAFIIVLIGGINSGILGLINVNILGLFGILYRLILIIIGVAAGYLVYVRFAKKETP